MTVSGEMTFFVTVEKWTLRKQGFQIKKDFNFCVGELLQYKIKITFVGTEQSKRILKTSSW